ncbi:MAG: cytochrome c biogenesis protein CcdA, partial [Gemmatimonadota bacterium]
MTDVSLPSAALAGLVSFLSPCVLPLVPGYLAFVAGKADLVDESAVDAARWHLLRRASAFVLGFATVFVLLGATATEI